MARNVSQFTKQKQAFSALLGVLLISVAPITLAAARYQVNDVDYNPSTQSVSLQSSGPVTATVNAVNIGRNKRIILDVEDAEIGNMPRDMALLQQLAQKWPAIRSASVNQFGGTHPVVRILLDVEGINYSTQITQNRSPKIEMKVLPTALTAAPQAFGGSAATVPVVPVQNSQPVTGSATIQELRRTLVTMNQKYDALQQENVQLSAQLQQEKQKTTINLKQDSPDVQRLKDSNASLQLQVNKLKQDLQKRMAMPPAAANSAGVSSELARVKAELGTVQAKVNGLQSENSQLRTQLTQAKNTPAVKPATAAVPINAPAAQKQMATLQQENTQLKQQVKILTDKVAAKDTGLKTLPPSTANITDPQLAEIKRQLEQAKGALNRSITTINEQNKEIAYLKRQVDGMQGVANANAQEQLTALNSQLEQRENEVKALKEQVAVLTAKVQADPANDPMVLDLRNQLQKKEALIEQQHAQLATAQQSGAELTSVKQQLSQCQAQYQQALTQITQLKSQDKSTALQQENATLKTQLDAVNAKLKTQPAADAMALQQRDAKIKTLEQNVADLNSRLLTLDGKLKQNEQALTQAKAAHAKAADAKLLTDEKKALSDQIQQLQTEQASLKQSLASSKADNAKLMSDLASARQVEQKAKTPAPTDASAPKKEDMAKLQTQLAQVTRERDDMRRNEQMLTEKLTSLQKEKTAQKPATATSQEGAQVKSLSTQVTALKKDKAQLTAVNESLFSELTALKAKQASKAAPQAQSQQAEQITALNNQIGTLEAQVNDLMQDKKELSLALEQAKQAKPAAVATAEKSSTTDEKPDEKVKTLELNNSMLKKQVADNNAKLTDLDTRYKRILGEYDKLQRQLKAQGTSANTATPAAAANADKAKLDQTTAENKRLQLQVGDLEKQLQAAQNKALALQKQVVTKAPAATAASTTKQPLEAVTLNTQPTDKITEADKHFRQAKSLDSGNQKTAAQDEYRKAIQLAPNNAEYVSALASSMAGQQHYGEAIHLLQEYIEAHSEQPEALNALGKIYLMNGQVDEARHAFSNALPVSTLSNYATTLKKQGKLAEAERVFKLVLDMSPNDSEVLFNLGNIYNAENNLPDAKASYTKALDVNPSFAEAHYNLGLVYSKMGDKPNAALHLEKFLELSPNAANAEVIRNYVKKLKG